MKNYLLKIKDCRVYFSNNGYIIFENTNFPDKNSFAFSERFVKYWEIVIKNFNEKNKEITVEVIDYEPNDISSFENQNNVLGFNTIKFENLEFDLFENQLSNYTKSKFKSITKDIITPPQQEKIIDTLIREKEEREKFIQKRIPFSIYVYFKNAEFYEGGVRITEQFKNIEKKLTIEISNSEIKKEFDYIKYHFHKVFHTKKFNVTGDILTTEHDGYLFDNINSDIISAVNGNIVSEIKKKEFKKIPFLNLDTEKKVFELNEILSLLDSENNHEKLNISEKEIIDHFLNRTDIKNKKELQFLSGHKQSNKEKIQFTFKPNFGFLFTIEGVNNKHYCWELFNSNATYIWSSYDTNSILNLVEDSLNIIYKKGRKKYIALLYNDPYFLDQKITFNKVIHRDPINKGFEKWKKEIIEHTI